MDALTSPCRIRNLARNLHDLLQDVAREYERLEAETAKLQAENMRLRVVMTLSAAEPSPHEHRLADDALHFQDLTPSESAGAADFKDASSQLDACSVASGDAEQSHTCPAEREVPVSPIGPRDIDVAGLWPRGAGSPASSSHTLLAALRAHGRTPSHSSQSAASAVSFGVPSASGSPDSEELQRSVAQGAVQVDACGGSGIADGHANGCSSPSNGGANSNSRRRLLPEGLVDVSDDHSGSSTNDGGACCHGGAHCAAAADGPPEKLGRCAFWADGEGRGEAGEAPQRASDRPLESEVPAPSWDLLNVSSAFSLPESSTHRRVARTALEKALPRHHEHCPDDDLDARPSKGLESPRRERNGVGSIRSRRGFKGMLGPAADSPASEGSSLARGFQGVLPSPELSCRSSPRRKSVEAIMCASPSSRRRQLESTACKAEGCRAKLVRVVATPYFDVFSGVLIMTNMIYMGIQAHFSLTGELHRLQGNPAGQDWFWMDLTFSVLFLVELMLRAVGLGREFVFGPDRRWHFLEVVLVGVSVSELVRINSAFDVSLLRGMRLIRIVRILQIASDSSIIGSLRNMMHSLGKSMVCFSPVVLLLGVVLYVFSIVFMQAVNSYLYNITEANLQDDGVKKVVSDMEKYYGSLSTTLLTLFMSISGGDSWIFAAQPLSEIGPLTEALFIIYIAFVLFALLNILNGLFVDAAVQSATAKRKLAVDKAVEDMSEMAAEITAMFAEADEDMNGLISKDELLEYTRNERTKACFESLELDVHSLVRLFDDIDTHNTGEVELKSFVERCIELRGVAKKADISLMENSIFRRLEIIEGLITQQVDG